MLLAMVAPPVPLLKRYDPAVLQTHGKFADHA